MHPGATLLHPWRRLRDLAHVTLLWHDDGPMGVTDFHRQTISLRRGMTQAERRSTVLHECLHVERGAVPIGLAAKEEQQVEHLTARLLIPDVRVLGDALAWAPDLHEAADHLWVDVDLLTTRLKRLHPSERHWLRRRLADGPGIVAPSAGH